MIDINKKLYEISEPGIIFLRSTKKKFKLFVDKIIADNSEQNVVKLLRGKRMKSRQSLFDNFSSILEFPSYFGNNWDALDECINDLEWLPGNIYILAINDAQEILSNESNTELDILLDLLKDTCKEWSQPPNENGCLNKVAKPFHVLFQYDDKDSEIVKKRFSNYFHENLLQ